jgi:hypothetical protein
VIEVYVNEYLMASFDEVCDAIKSSHTEVVVPVSNGIRISDQLRRVSKGVACMAFKYSDGPDAEWETAEVRVLEVESGGVPLTELLLIVLASARTARSILQLLVRQLEDFRIVDCGSPPNTDINRGVSAA